MLETLVRAPAVASWRNSPMMRHSSYIVISTALHSPSVDIIKQGVLCLSKTLSKIIISYYSNFEVSIALY